MAPMWTDNGAGVRWKCPGCGAGYSLAPGRERPLPWCPRCGTHLVPNPRGRRKEGSVPTVGTGKNAKHFPYTPAGMRAAQEESARTGKPVIQEPPGKGPAPKPAPKAAPKGKR